MRILRAVHAGSLSLAFCLPVLALGGGCDGGAGSSAPSVKETPEDAAARGKTIAEAYKSDPARKKQMEAVTGKK